MPSGPILVYVLRSPETGRRYVGITNDLARRLAEHRSGSSKGSNHLDGTFKVTLTEEYPDYAAARIREKFLKSGQGRKWLSEQGAQPDP